MTTTLPVSETQAFVISEEILVQASARDDVRVADDAARPARTKRRTASRCR